MPDAEGQASGMFVKKIETLMSLVRVPIEVGCNTKMEMEQLGETRTAWSEGWDARRFARAMVIDVSSSGNIPKVCWG